MLILICTLVGKSKCLLQYKTFHVCNYIQLYVNIYIKVSICYFFLLKTVPKEATKQI